MKKILIIVGLAFGCSSVYAQVPIATNIVDQLGNNNKVLPPDQTGADPSTKFNITQRNDWNLVNITQGGPMATTAGFGNYALLIQKSAATPAGFMTAALKNTITVVQNGVNNYMYGTQIGVKNSAYMRQGTTTGNGKITMEQYGFSNATGIYQDAGKGNQATVKQGTTTMLTDPFAGTDPMQGRNSAELRQSGEAGVATIVQQGTLGYVKAIQSGGVVAPNTIDIAQTNNGGIELTQGGDNNKVSATQRGFQIATVEQGATSKNGNISIVQGDNPTADTRNNAVLKQLSGDGNKITLYQEKPTSQSNMTKVTQTGNNGTVTSTQEGKSSWVEVTQSGADNKANFVQKNAALTKGSVVTLTQTGTGGGVAPFNVDIIQDGSDHRAYLTQAGVGNTIISDQIGVGNKEWVDQLSGSGMTALVAQKDGVAGTSSQKNEARITQAGTDEAGATTVGTPGFIDYSDPYNPVFVPPVTTTAPGTSSGLAAEIRQGGREDKATIDQKGTSNNATIKQLHPYSFQSKGVITQEGKGNNATVDQFGKKQDAEVTQAAGTTNGKINVTQGTLFQFNPAVLANPDMYTTDNKAVVKQLAGNKGEIILNQDNSRNVATLTQESGNENYMKVQQRPNSGVAQPGSSPASFGNGLTEKGNTATITQKGGNKNIANLSQQGNLASATGLSYDNELTLTQQGNNNVLGRTNSTDAASQTGHGNRANALTQTGNGLFLGLDQAGTNGKVKTTQTGTENATGIYQFSGDNNQADVTQGGGGVGVLKNQAVIYQTGDNNNTKITNQTGTENKIFIDQANGTLAGLGNTATVVQAGVNNLMIVGQSGQDNKSIIDQKGTNNGEVGGVISGGAFTYQKGVNNQATITQDATKSLVSIGQGGVILPFTPPTIADAQSFLTPISVQDNKAKVDQLGVENTTQVEQNGNKGDVKVTQAGTENKTYAYQYNPASTPGTETPPVVVFPTPLRSNLNIVTVIQTANVAKSLADIKQIGQENTANINQVKGTGMVAVIGQTESAYYNLGTKTHITGADGNNSRKNLATITQEGTDVMGATVTSPIVIDYTNPYSPVPTGGVTTPGALVSAANLTAMAFQEGREGIADINQKGTSNTAVVKQYAPYSFQNKAYITQEGIKSGVIIDQFGGRQYAKADQSAGVESSSIVISQGIGSLFNPAVPSNPESFTNDNKAWVKQLAGTNNNITLSQNNERNEARLTQESGSFNTITVNQYPQDPADTQPGTAVAPSTGLGNNNQKGNKVMITQKTGDGNVANLNQFGYDNELTLTQDGQQNVLAASGGSGIALQEGHGNRAVLSQTGSFHVINLQQGGVSNTAMVTQTN